jgi:hypothetical protein
VSLAGNNLFNVFKTCQILIERKFVLSKHNLSENFDTNKAEIDFGSDHIIIARRYRALGALNDLFIAIWFLTGSVLFFFDSLMTGGTWLFVVGSLQLLLRPAITLAELIHVKRVYRSRPATSR